MSKLLTGESPLQLLPSLAAAIGLNESIVLQQIHYWLVTKPKIHEGKPWVYNSAPEWQQQFPFWSVPTIRRILGNLRDAGILEVGNFNPEPQDRTFWYTINYDKIPCQTSVQPCDQPDQMTSDQSDQIPCDQVDQIPVDHVINLDTPCDQPDQMQVINLITSYSRTETNTETNNRDNSNRAEHLDGTSVPDQPTVTEPMTPATQRQVNAFGRPIDGPEISLEALPSGPKNLSSVKAQPIKVGTAQPGQLVKAGTGQNAYWIFREYFTRSLTNHQTDLILSAVSDLPKWRQVCERWAEVYGNDWYKFGLLDWYRDGIPGNDQKKSSRTSLQRTNGAKTNGSAKVNPLYAQFG